MDALQASAASLGLFYSRRALDDPQYIVDAVVRLIAKIPTMVAAFELIRHGHDPIQPRDDLSYAANFLHMLTEREPDPMAARVFDACLILHAEHSLNASTFSARVTASTLTDPYAVVASAVGTLAGPLHGGANEDVLQMLEEIGTVDQVEAYLERAIKEKRKIMGFGHREYRVKDPRAVILQQQAEDLFNRFGHDAMYDVATTGGGGGRRPAGAQGDLPKRRLLLRSCLPEARHTPRSVHSHLRHRAGGRLAGPLEGAAGSQSHLSSHPDLHRVRGSPVDSPGEPPGSRLGSFPIPSPERSSLDGLRFRDEPGP